MTPITPENIYKHELIGMMVEIIQSPDMNIIGLKGTIIDEFHNIFVLETFKEGDVTKTTHKLSIPKRNNVFRFSLPSGELVDVDGELLNSRSENRLKNNIRKRW